MKKKYTQKDIDQFFGNFKELPDYFDLEKVHHLINNPAAKATQPGNNYFKPYKFLIMTSATIITLVAALLLWPEVPVTIQEEHINPNQNTSINIEGEEGGSHINLEEEEVSPKEREIEKSHTNQNPKVIPEVKVTGAKDKKVDHQDKEFKLANETLENSWPADTVIDGSQLLITLTDEELERLGFMLDETGIYYYNVFEEQEIFFSSTRDNNGASISSIGTKRFTLNKKVEPSHYGFFPITITDAFHLYQKSQKSFKLMDDTLAPVIIKSHQHKFDDDDRIIWYKINENFIDALPERYHYLRSPFIKIAKVKKMFPDTDIVKYERKSVLDNMRFIELTERELIRIGFEINEEELIYKDAKVNLWFKKSGGAGVSMKSYDKSSGPDSIFVSFLSNEYGQQMLKWWTAGEDIEKGKTSYFLDKTQILVPIVMRKTSYPHILKEDQVFWFEPSEALFATLPDEIGSQLRQEYDYLTAPNEEARKYLSTSCTFFEACKSTLQVNNLKLMPNPASFATTISFDGLEEALGTISLVNLSGNLVKVLVPNETFKKGTNTFLLDLSGIGPGIYLISINTGKGFKTQRLIITR